MRKRMNPLEESMFKNNMGNLAFAVLGTTVPAVAILCVPQLIQIVLDKDSSPGLGKG